MYYTLKHLHLSMVALTFGLFCLRGFWMLAESPRLGQTWVKVLPHVIDTILLTSAIAMLVVIGQLPFAYTWITAKLIALLIYIVLGSIALKRGRTRTARCWALLGAVLAFAYIVAVAFAQDPWPFPD